MKKQLFRLPESMSPQARNAFLIALLIGSVHFAAVPYYVYSGLSTGAAQFYTLAALAIVQGMLFGFGAVLSRRGKPTAGIILGLGVLAVTYPYLATLVSGIGLVIGSALMVAGPMMAFQVLPRRSAWVMTIITVASGLVTVLLDGLGSAARPSLPGIFIQLMGMLVVGVLGYFIIRVAWRGSIRVKLVASFTVIALISVASVGTVVYISYRNQVREDIRQRLFNIVSITAKRLDGDLHATLQTAEDMQTKAYRQMMAEGDEIIATDPELKFSYTMRMNKQGQIYFVIDSRRADDTERDSIGTIYDEPSETLQAFFKAPDHPIVEEEIYTDKYGSVLSAYAPFYRADGALEGIFGIDIAADVVLERERNILYLILGTTLGTMFLVTLIGLWLGNLFVGPVLNLSAVAKKITEGDLSARAKIETTDEVGDLAQTINAMTSQLQGTLQGLEQRVEERTQSLELAAEVGRSVSQVRALDVMLKDAAELIRSRFNLYYVQVYLTDPSQTNLILQSGTGAVGAQLVGRGHRLVLNTASINGRAAIEKHAVVVTDTHASATFRPNPLLPDTRSEMAVPLLIGEKVVGVLDLQSRQAGALNLEVLSAFEALAGQLAIAIQNATFLAETQQARADVEDQARRLSRANWVDYMDAIHQPEEIGFLFEQNKIALLSQAEKSQTAENNSALVAPIAVTGAALGNLVVELAGQSPIARTHELVNAVARQVGQQIENLRLLESAERFRFEAEQSARRLTREGWKEFADTNAGEHLSYLYDLKEVRPYQAGADPTLDDSGFSLPLKVRDEAVGKLSVQGLKSDDQESLDLVNAVAERLGTHIESLRQQDQTQLALSQTEKLSVASLRLAQATDMQEVLKVIDETLAISAINRSVLGVFNYNAANELEEMVIGANWWNGSGHEPSEIGRRYTLETLNALPYFTSPVPVFAHDTFNDERITGVSLQIVKQQNIRAMAVLPLYVGTRQIGVLILESEQVYNFTPANTRLFVAMAPQVATVLENRRQFERAQKQAKRETTLNLISQKIQGATTVEAVLQIAARELGQALGAPRTIAQLSIRDKK